MSHYSMGCPTNLQPWIDGEATSSGVHAGDILHIVDLLQNKLGPVIPVVVVQVLPKECVRLDSTIRVHLGHVHIINEVHQLLVAWRAIVLPRLLLQWLLHHLLKHEGGGVVVEGDHLHQCVLIEGSELLPNQNSLPCAGTAHKHNRTPVGHEEVHEVANASCLTGVYQDSLYRSMGQAQHIHTLTVNTSTRCTY